MACRLCAASPSGDRQLDAALLEPRVLLSASPIAVALIDSFDPSPESLDNSFDLDDRLGSGHLVDFGASLDDGGIQAADPNWDVEVVRFDEGDSMPPDPSPSQELVFVDTGAGNYQQLVDDLVANSDPDRMFDVHLLDGGRDGVEQISEILADYQEVGAVHLVSHGTEGQVKLGNTWLSFGNLDGFAGDIAGWNNSFNDGADLLIYGCDLAGDENGQLLIEALGALCDCDIAASVDSTGSESLGGDWELEYSLGEIEADVAFSVGVQQEWDGLLALFTVTNTNDAGAGSLRQAIINANGAPGLDTIDFNIAGAGPHTIAVTSALPAINDAVIIDGYTQPGATANTLPFGSDAVLKIQIDGGLASDVDGLSLAAGSDGSTIRGLSITGFVAGTNGGEAIDIQSDSNFIRGNYIGLDADGSTTSGNRTAIDIHGGASDNMIGGTNPADRNVLSANSYAGVFIRNVNSDNNEIYGNYIGLDASGVTLIGNNAFGVVIFAQADGNIVGGINAGEANVVAGNGNGVLVDTTAINTSIRGNSIYANTGEGIDLENDGVTFNDLGDGDTGPNNLQNFPILTAAIVSGTDLTVTGSLDSTPSTAFDFDFFASTTQDASGYGEAERYIGSAPGHFDRHQRQSNTRRVPDRG